MGTEILRPQDCLIERMRVGSPVFSSRSRRSYYSGNYSSNPSNTNTNTKSFRKQTVVQQKKRFHPQQPQQFSETLVSKKSTSSSSGDEQQLKPGHVTILKRGESLDVKKRNEAPRRMVAVARDVVVCGTERLGPEQPKMVPKQIRISDLKLIMSPPPSPPLPTPSSSVVVRCDVYAGSGFAVSPSPSSLPLPSFNKKKEFMAVVDDSATKDLRRLLRLE